MSARLMKLQYRLFLPSEGKSMFQVSCQVAGGSPLPSDDRFAQYTVQLKLTLGASDPTHPARCKAPLHLDKVIFAPLLLRLYPPLPSVADEVDWDAVALFFADLHLST